MSASPSDFLQAAVYSHPPTHSNTLLVPDRWSPSGWKYVPPTSPPSTYFRHRHPRQSSLSIQSTVRTTHQSHYVKHQFEHCVRPVRSSFEQFPPLPSDSGFIDTVLKGYKGGKVESSANRKDWASQWVQKRSFGRRSHRDTEWQRMYQSQGTIREQYRQ